MSLEPAVGKLGRVVPVAIILALGCTADLRFDSDSDPFEDRYDCAPEDSSIHPGAPSRADAITCTATVTDAGGDVPNISFTWLQNGIPLPQTGPTLAAGLVTRGAVVGCRVNADDGMDVATPAQHDTTVINAPPTLNAAIVPPVPTARTGAALSGAGQDPDGDALSFDIDWIVDGFAAWSNQGASNLSDLPLPPLGFVRGAQIEAVINPWDEFDVGPTLTLGPVTAANSAPDAGMAIISPADPDSTDTLSCAAPGVTDPDGDPLLPTWVWRLDPLSG